MRRRLGPTILLTAMLVTATVAPAAAATRPFPDEITLPNGFAPEGIATGNGTTFYTGSLSGQGIWRGDYRTGEGSFLVSGGGPFVGLDVDARHRLWVAGGAAGNGHVFDSRSGAPITTFAFGATPTFVNDVVVTTDAAYFTDSSQPALYRVPIRPGGAIGVPEVIALDPLAIGFTAGAFNLNGIVASPDGSTLIAVNSAAGILVAIHSASGAVTPIDLGGASVAAGDGLLLHGRTLFVVRNELERIAVVELTPDLSSGSVVAELTSRSFDVPTTIARFGSSLYAVNARFDTPVTPATEYWVTRIDR